MKWLSALVLAAALGAGCQAHDPRPTADDIVCLCKGDLGCVCVRVDGQTPRSEYQGKMYYFCGKSCKVEFDKDPEKWVQAYKNLKK
jgi:YHS domain-containing protein